VQGAVATFFDITERMQMQAALREGELRMARLVDAVTDGVITIDARETVVFFNRAAEAMFGVTAADAIGSPITRFIPRRLEHGNGKDASRTANGHDETALFGGLHELTGRRADARTFPIEASLSTLETGTETLITVVLRDVTQQHAARAERQMREALEATSRAKTEFLSRMSHELRTPLNAVLGFSQLLRLDAVRPPSLQQLERIQHIENAGSHLLALVNDVLDLSRVESGQMTALLEAVDLRCVLADALVMVSALAADAHVELRMSRSAGEDDGPPSVIASAHEEQGDAAWAMADPVRLRQVLVNLLSNAVKYNRAGGRVRISWAHQRDGWHVRIADTGLGMTPDKLTRLFEPFNRLGAEKSKIEGTGIGLVLSRRLVELMNGELTVDSVVGRGTTATVILPSAEEPDTGPGALAPPSQHGVLDRGLSVLYAEDDEVNAELVRQVASLRPGVALRVAGTGAAALKIAQQEPPDLMLIDMNLGDMTGAELARALRQNPITRGIRLVALSADALPEQIDAAIAGGFESYLTKPIDFRRLLNLLDGKPSIGA